LVTPTDPLFSLSKSPTTPSTFPSTHPDMWVPHIIPYLLPPLSFPTSIATMGEVWWNGGLRRGTEQGEARCSCGTTGCGICVQEVRIGDGERDGSAIFPS